ncbi:MAG: hypothetical protein EBT15_04405 [Betaproteobacteria bacterium]|nr:hypothetical protein [Betaproteobacteria bacterium]
MATVVINQPNHIEFKNVSAVKSPADAPTVSFQAGDWDAENYTEAGIVVDVFGPQLPLLSPADARKLAKWLARAADDLEGVKHDKKRKHRPRSDEDDDQY